MTMNRGPDGRPYAFLDLPEKAFPVTITAYVDGEEIWERIIEPYVMVDIPSATPETVGRVALRISRADGEVEWHDPVSAEEADAYIEEQMG